MDWTLDQIHRIEDLMKWYGKKVDKLVDALESGKVKVDTYWDDAQKLTKNIKTTKAIREWTIVFENMENIILNKYIEEE